MFRDACTGRKVVRESMLAKISASGLKEAEIIQINGETKMNSDDDIPEIKHEFAEFG